MLEQINEDTKNIKGWAADADPTVRPYNPVHKLQENTGAHWSKPEAQFLDVEILKSIERPDLTAVYGTPNPPRGLSGVIRRLAFKSSEGNFSHWLPLMLADRIDFFEGIFEDIFKGRMPKILGDGLRSDLKYNKAMFFYRVTKIILFYAVVIYLVSLIF